MKWNQFRLKTTTEAEDIVSSMLQILERRSADRGQDSAHPV